MGDSFPKPIQRPHPPIFVGGGGKRILSIAAREANIVGFGPRTRTDGSGLDVTDATAEATERKIAWVRQAAGERFNEIEVNDPTAKAEGLCLCSTAIRRIWRDAPLWLQRTTHRGVLTRRPCSSSLAGRAAFSAQYYAHRSNRHGEYNGNSDTRTANPDVDGSRPRHSRTWGRLCWCSGHPPSRSCCPPQSLCRRCSRAVGQRPTWMPAGSPCVASCSLVCHAAVCCAHGCGSSLPGR